MMMQIIGFVILGLFGLAILALVGTITLPQGTDITLRTVVRSTLLVLYWVGGVVLLLALFIFGILAAAGEFS